MAEAKTKATATSVAAHLATVEDPVRRADCEAIGRIMRKVTCLLYTSPSPRD